MNMPDTENMRDEMGQLLNLCHDKIHSSASLIQAGLVGSKVRGTVKVELDQERAKELERMDPEDCVEALSAMSQQEREAFFANLPPEQQAAALAAMTPKQRARMLNSMSPEERQASIENAMKSMSPEERDQALAALSAEDRAKFLCDMTEEERNEMLMRMSPAERAATLDMFMEELSPQERAKMMESLGMEDKDMVLAMMTPSEKAVTFDNMTLEEVAMSMALLSDQGRKEMLASMTEAQREAVHDEEMLLAQEAAAEVLQGAYTVDYYTTL